MLQLRTYVPYIPAVLLGGSKVCKERMNFLRFLKAKKLLLLIVVCIFISVLLIGHIKTRQSFVLYSNTLWSNHLNSLISDKTGLGSRNRSRSVNAPSSVSVTSVPTTQNAGATVTTDPLNDARKGTRESPGVTIERSASTSASEPPPTTAMTPRVYSKVLLSEPQSKSHVSKMESKGTDSSPFPTVESKVTGNPKPIIGEALVDVWSGVEGFLVDDLRKDTRFPHHPSKSLVRVSSLEYRLEDANSGVKIYGYLSAPTTGDYIFGILSSNTSEMWLSTSEDSQSLSKIVCLGCIDQEHLPQRTLPVKPSTYVSRIDFSWSSTPASKIISLMKDNLYLFEIYLKNEAGSGFVGVQWKTPGSRGWTAIPSDRLSYTSSLPDQLRRQVLPSYTLQHPLRVAYIGDDVVNSTVLNGVLPECDYHPMYARRHFVGRYRGYLEIKDSGISPDDHTLYRNNGQWSAGNPPIHPARVKYVVDEYTKALQHSNHGDRFDRLELRMMEETANILHTTHDGWRYLLEADVYWRDVASPTHISEYVYRPERVSSAKLCLVRGHQWKKDAMVHIVIPVKNQGKWIVHVVKNLEDIYLSTRDDRFTLLIVDYESTDINVSEVIAKSRLPQGMLKLITLKGAFTRTVSIQTGIDSIKDPDDIIMTMDLHLTMPTGFIQSIRKHTIKGRMGYVPVVVRMNPRYTEHNINGFWEVLGYGLISLYKSDWDAIGGMNTREFKEKWGGEDWEFVDRVISKGYELFRHRYPSFVHYYHTHQGMWDNSKNR